jgi:hypothetical protein
VRHALAVVLLVLLKCLPVMPASQRGAGAHGPAAGRPRPTQRGRHLARAGPVPTGVQSRATSCSAGCHECPAAAQYLRTLSYLSEADRKAYADRQSVSFMYQKPPGLDAALSRDGLPPVRRPKPPGAAALVNLSTSFAQRVPCACVELCPALAQESRPGGSGAGAAAAGPAPGPGGEAAGQAAAGAAAPAPGAGSAPGQGAPGPGMPPARASESDKKYIANMLGAVSALQEHEKCALWMAPVLPAACAARSAGELRSRC